MPRLPLTRQQKAQDFEYFYADGTRLQDQKLLERIKSLAIPPAWRNVRVAAGPGAKVQAMGVDDAGRKQYIYNPNFRLKQEAAKFDRIVNFGKKLPRLRKRVSKDMKRKKFDKIKVAAFAVHLMDEAYFRVGNSQYAEQNQTYGLTTLRSKHLEIEGDTVIFNFTGKSHQKQHKKIKNRTLARILKQLDEMPGYELFRYYDSKGQLHNLSSTDINEYIKETIGDDFSAKDFRTWGGTLLACVELAKQDRPGAEAKRKKVVTECVKKVANRLGNTPSVTRKSYIDPRVINFFNEAVETEPLYKAIQSAGQSNYTPELERCALKILSLKP